MTTLIAAPAAGVVVLSAADARALTIELREAVETARGAAERVYELLQRAQDGHAYTPLGYDTWKEYVEGELGITRQRANQVMQEGEVVRELRAALPEITSNAFDVSGRAAREIRPVLPEVVLRVRERVSGGVAPAVALAQTVQEIRDEVPDSRRKPKRVHRRFKQRDREEEVTPKLVRWYEEHSQHWDNWSRGERESAALGLYRLAGEVRRLREELKGQGETRGRK